MIGVTALAISSSKLCSFATRLLIANLSSSYKEKYDFIGSSSYTTFREHIKNLQIKNKCGAYLISDRCNFSDIPINNSMIVVLQYEPLTCICFDSTLPNTKIFIGVAWNYELQLTWRDL